MSVNIFKHDLESFVTVQPPIITAVVLVIDWKNIKINVANP